MFPLRKASDSVPVCYTILADCVAFGTIAERPDIVDEFHLLVPIIFLDEQEYLETDQVQLHEELVSHIQAVCDIQVQHLYFTVSDIDHSSDHSFQMDSVKPVQVLDLLKQPKQVIQKQALTLTHTCRQGGYHSCDLCFLSLNIACYFRVRTDTHGILPTPKMSLLHVPTPSRNVAPVTTTQFWMLDQDLKLLAKFCVERGLTLTESMETVCACQPELQFNCLFTKRFPFIYLHCLTKPNQQNGHA